jgi:hypothetical protein
MFHSYIMATESMKEHKNISNKVFIFRVFLWIPWQ